MDKQVLQEVLFHMQRLLGIDALKISTKAAIDKALAVLGSNKTDRQKKAALKQIAREIDALNIRKDLKGQLITIGASKKEVIITLEEFNKINIGGFSVQEYIDQNKKNTANRFLSTSYTHIFSPDDAIDLDQDRKIRLVQTLTTAQSILTAGRGLGRSLLGKNKECQKWINIGVADSRQTKVCRRHKGAVYLVPYRYIENKPPRRPPVHRCRSFLLPVLGKSNYVPPKTIKDLINRNKDASDYIKSRTGIDNPDTFQELQAGLLLSMNTINELTK